MQDYAWDILDDSTIDSINTLIKVLSVNRGINDLDNFINPLSPSKFLEKNAEMKELVERHANLAKKLILEAIEKGQKIIIHGDYDVDGQTAVAIMWKTIYEDMGYKSVYPYIPNRFDEGYGLSMDSLSSIGTTFRSVSPLLITVDCGIVSTKEVLEAKKRGYTVIITDHHETHDALPKADVIVHTTKATGAGISWILSHALSPQTSQEKLGLAALGTICDLQPLTSFNRSIAKHGLDQLNASMPIGIEALSQLAQIKGKISSYEAGWLIGPRLNATGRMEDAMDSLRLLSTNSYTQARKLAKKLNELNRQRQEKTLLDLKFAISDVEKTAETPKFIITSHKNYHEGIIGLIAGKLTQTYYRPSIAIAINEKEQTAKGSARSIRGISIIDVLHKFDDLFEGLGGHDMAAGFSIKSQNIPMLQEKLAGLNEWADSIFQKKLKIDGPLDTQLINQKTYYEIDKFRPFGTGNPEPIFCSQNMKIINISKFGKENDHIRLFLEDSNQNQFTALYFGKGLLADKLFLESKIDIAYNLSMNTWNGNNNLELKIRDLRKNNS